jgi:hypothetical protein
MSMPVKKDSLTVTGLTKQVTRIADSGNEVTGVFCPECGVRIYHVLKSAQDVLALKPGTLDDTSWLRPGYFIWMKSAHGWVPVPNGRSVIGLNEPSEAETASVLGISILRERVTIRKAIGLVSALAALAVLAMS